MKKPEPTEYPYNPQTWKKKYECKKGKGDHKWVVTWAFIPSQHWVTNLWGDDKIFVYKECSVCGKQTTDYDIL